MSDIGLSMQGPVSRLGLTGYLSPDGEFFPCKYYTHSSFSEVMYAHAASKDKEIRRHRKLLERTEDFVRRIGYIAMGSKGPGYRGHGHVRFPASNHRCEADEYVAKITDKQIKWLRSHYHELDENQQMWVMLELGDSEAFRNIGEQECPACGGSGFSGIGALFGNGYDAVCDHCGGYRKVSSQDGGEQE
ncbi:hypothetical protein [Paenibacillus oleatilyticus]|uniref:Uncharacterized protein n=1 Tax=Paenibacillus oleatilyticus TaxID=2594886 RepID=A0ABV4UT31_9BACL